jgi:hypothetical protein
MRTVSKSLVLAALGAGLLAAAPASAVDSTEWLQRQFSTNHRELTAREAMSARGARSSDESGHAYAAAWLDRQFTGKSMAFVSTEGVAGRTGPTERDMSAAPLSDAWLKHQFTTDHPTSAY